MAQVTEPIPPPTTPGTVITNLTSATGYVRAKATPDECWTGLGENTRADFIDQQTPQTPCNANQIPKVDQGYIWGQVLVGSQIFFGTFANPQCVGTGEGAPDVPIVVSIYWACEYGDSPYSTTKGGLTPASLGDDRPPRMYIYDIPSQTIRDITPKLGGSPPASVCGPTGTDPLCTDVLWNTMLGVRSAASYVEPTTGNTYVIVSGPGAFDTTDFFVWGIKENRWVGKFLFIGYSDVRHWVTYQNVLYAAVFKPDNATTGAPSGGALVRYTGNFTVIPPANPLPINDYNAIPFCGTESVASPPVGASFCIAFQDVGDFDTHASEVVGAPVGITDSGRIFVGTWPPNGAVPHNEIASIYMSPVVPAGGLTPANASQWTKVWNVADYDPDPLLVTTYGIGAMSFYDGYLYWGTLNPPLVAVQTLFNVYGEPTDPTTIAEDSLLANRTAVLFRAQNLSTGSPSVNLLYGSSALSVFVPPTSTTPSGTWAVKPNNVPGGTCTTACGTRPLYGQSGFDNIFTNYIWSMGILNSNLYVGTMNWEFLAYAQGSNNLTQNLPLPPAKFGAGLFYFPDTSHAASSVSINGLGNFLNYGVRNISSYNSMLFLGMANPMNLATTGTTNITGADCLIAECRGGWELIELGPASSAP